jgi:uncharacterized spore protein YtfJ
LNRNAFTIVVAGLIAATLAVGQSQPGKKTLAPTVQPAGELAEELAQRLSNDLHLKTVVGEPIKVGTVTLIPILTVDVSFGGGGVATRGTPAATAPQNPATASDAFFMSGEARPLGFVAITKKGTRFISVSKTPVK